MNDAKVRARNFVRMSALCGSGYAALYISDHKISDINSASVLYLGAVTKPCRIASLLHEVKAACKEYGITCTNTGWVSYHQDVYHLHVISAGSEIDTILPEELEVNRIPFF